MSYLLDVNVLIALIDRFHVHHEIAHTWLADKFESGWATCALTENGVVRILSNPGYTNCPGPPAIVAENLRALRHAEGHTFWSETISLLDPKFFDIQQIRNSHQVTDSYLLGLAVQNGALLATFDRRINTAAVVGGAEALHVIET